MALSMTGYGKSLCENETISLRVEIKSINSRFLDMSLKLPRNISFAEEKVRNLLRTRITRGKVDCYVTVIKYRSDECDIDFNEKAADNYYMILRNIEKRYHLHNGISATQIASYQGVLTSKDDEETNEELTGFILKAFNEAIDNMYESKKIEGKTLAIDCIDKVTEFNGFVNKVEILTKDLPAQYKQKLEKRLSELLGDLKTDENRIAQEIALFADRACVDEELTRLYSHISQFKIEVLKDGSGKKLDFILQEMLRETNTIASKANNLDITNCTLEMKCILEKIREQIQNLE
ncbi:MAG: YicC/YloC family endoribonuclease [Clostridia bacterium]|jgi:uncharacterized protein (TIGR00255 family)